MPRRMGPRKGQKYTLLLDGGQVKGWGTKDSWLLIVFLDLKKYHGIQKAVHPFRFKNFEHLLLGSGGGGAQFKTRL